MSESGAESCSTEDRVNAVIAEYFRRVDAGEEISPEALIADHPDIGDKLHEFFDAADVVEQFAGPTVGQMLSHASQDTARSLSSTDTSIWRLGLDQSSPKSVIELPVEIGRYRLDAIVGEGAMGTVYRAFDTELQRQVAIKVPKFGEDENDEVRQRFYREAQSAATLRHPNICPVFDAAEIDGVHFISMAYIDGKPLSSGSYEDRPDHEKADLILKLAKALQKAHRSGIIHRDVKPGNIIIDGDGEPILTDFGLARDGRHDNARLSHPDAIIGSPVYMAPEQLHAADGDVGPATDIYGLGVVFYELLVGRPPFSGSTLEVLTQVATKVPPSPSEQNPVVDSRFDLICKKMMEKKIEDRFVSMSEVAEAIELCLQGARPVSDAAQRKTRKILRPTAVVAALAVLAIAISSVVVIVKSNGSSATIEIHDPGVTVTVGQDVVKRSDSGQTIKLSAGEHTLVVEGDGLRFESQIDIPKGSNLRVTTRFVDGHLVVKCDERLLGVVEPEGTIDLMPHELHRFTPNAGAVRSVAFSPDGQSFLCGADDGVLRMFRMDQDEPILSLAGHEEQINAVRFSPDGKYALSGGKDRAIRLWDLSAGKLTMYFTGNLDKVRCLRFFRDGQRFVSGGSDAQIRFWRVGQATPVATCGYRDDEPIPTLQAMEDLEQLKAHVTWIRSIDIAPEETHLVSGGNDGLIAIWDVETKSIVRRLIGHRAPVSSVAYSRDGTRILSGGFDNTLRLWDADTGKLLQTLTDHGAPVRSVAFSDNGQQAYSVSIDATVRTWDLANQSVIATFDGHVGEIHALDVSPASPRILSAGADGTIRLWEMVK